MTTPVWFPDKPALYDIEKSYAENAADGPFFQGDVPKRVFPPESKWLDFLGHKIASPLGIPAGPLLTAKWIALSAALGFDVLTYKTIRSAEHPAHSLPNMIFVDPSEKPAKRIPAPCSDIAALAVTNSFGMPSKSPTFLMEDIARANASLQPGQVMIVSVVGTPRAEISFAQDFVRAAAFAKEAGAQIIEANFSCPNVDKKEGCLYLSEETVGELTTALVKAIHPIPLILKMGLFASEAQMRSVLIAAARAGAHAVCGINTISMAVVDEKGDPALGPNRLTSGICGGPIRAAALDFVRQAHQINQQEKLGLTILGVGGITLPEHFDHFLDAGAKVALSATGMMWDPYLAARYHQNRSYS
jgi:dihydroorotate dehydrogenase (NAD+) catalytic subunit